MGKLRVFEVVFEGNEVIFKPGDFVRGHVRIVLSEAKDDIRGIVIKFVGKSRTSWSEGSSEHRRHYSWTEKFFSQEVIAFGKSKKTQSSEKVQLPAGDHRFPFQFQLPACELPPPFESFVGSIRYYVSAKIDRPWKFDHATKRLFSIHTVKDLNTVADVWSGQRDEKDKTVCCLCCATGPISVQGSIQKSGYVPGERIWVTGKVDNQSSREICKVTVALLQHVIYKGKRNGSGYEHTRTDDIKVAELRLNGCQPYDSVEVIQQPLLIPPVPCTGWPVCSNIIMNYVVQIEADVSGTPLDAEVRLPITIGTIPATKGYPPAGGAAYPPSPEMPIVPSTDIALESVPPPPTYELAVGGLQEVPSKDGHEYTFGKLMYAPHYPYYNLDEPGSTPSSQQPN